MRPRKAETYVPLPSVALELRIPVELVATEGAVVLSDPEKLATNVEEMFGDTSDGRSAFQVEVALDALSQIVRGAAGTIARYAASEKYPRNTYRDTHARNAFEARETAKIAWASVKQFEVACSVAGAPRADKSWRDAEESGARSERYRIIQILQKHLDRAMSGGDLLAEAMSEIETGVDPDTKRLRP